MRFAKWQGLGNDYLLVDRETLPAGLTTEAVALLCDRHYGLGADGILVHDAPTGAVPGAVARMRIYNPDGTEAEMCGNGVRMFARYLRATRAVTADEFALETLAGPIIPRLLPDGRVRVHMGTARFRSANYRADGPGDADEVVGETLETAGGSYRFTFVDVGNPHCVIQASDMTGLPLSEIGPPIERHGFFPNRANVEFIHPEPDGSVTMRVWERGVGETQACGTGATAVGAAAVRLGVARSPVTVHLLGGDLEIEVAPDWQVVMTGPAREVYEAELSAELLEQLGWATSQTEP